MKKYIILICIVLFMGVIFLFSNVKGEESDRQSIGLLENTIGNIASIIDKDITEEEKNELYLRLNYPLRKTAHVLEFFALSLLICLFLHNLNIDMLKVIIFTFIISFAFACGDEIHQLFVPNRNGCFLDVMIDTIGILILLIIYYFKERRKV